jgi:hypothetical protein
MPTIDFELLLGQPTLTPQCFYAKPQRCTERRGGVVHPYGALEVVRGLIHGELVNAGQVDGAVLSYLGEHVSLQFV